jgi:acetate kinase
MAGQVLVINTGSSSLKYQLIDPESGEWAAKGLVERIGEGSPRLLHERRSQPARDHALTAVDHAGALGLVLDRLRSEGTDLGELIAVGHRVVHGGSEFQRPVVIDDEVVAAIEKVSPLAPLHNPAGLLGIRVMRDLLPDVPQVAVFDTAFHATMPPEAYTYAIPTEVAREQQIRRYGFHGSSYAYVTRRAAAFLGIPVEGVNLIVCHLGNGASMAAIRGGRSIDTTMGMTPLQGLVMGTRSGDVDAGVIFHLVDQAGLSSAEVDRMLNKDSGLKGLAGHQDMREVRTRATAGDAAARLALDVYAYRIRGYIGAYLAVLPRVDALVFTAGIGEHDADLRREVCEPLGHLGVHLDHARNEAAEHGTRAIDDGTGGIRILVVPTNEEAEIAREAAVAVRG